LRKFFAATFVFIVISFSILYSLTPKYRTKQPIKLAISSPVYSFDPAKVIDKNSLFVISQSLESLYQYNYLKRPLELEPALADGMPEVSADGLVYKIKIKPEVQYHSLGILKNKIRFVEADDFIWQIKRLAFLATKSSGRWIFSGRLRGFDEFSARVNYSQELFLQEQISGLKKIDKYTFELHLTGAEPNFIHYLAMSYTSPVPFELIVAHQNKLDDHLIGTGAYQFDEFRDNNYYFKKFTNYRYEKYPQITQVEGAQIKLGNKQKLLPLIDDLTIKVINSDDFMWKSFELGDLDILEVPQGQLYKLADPNSRWYRKLVSNNVIIKHFSKRSLSWLAFNMQDSLIGKNKILRQAIAHAIDFNKYLKLMTGNTNLRANSMYNPTLKEYKPQHVLPYLYDIKKARELVKKSGIKPQKLKFNFSTRGVSQKKMDEAVFFQKQLAKIGIELSIKQNNFFDFFTQLAEGEVQMWSDYWSYDYPDAQNIIQLLVNNESLSINKSSYSNPKVDQLYQKLVKTHSGAMRKKLAHQIEDEVEHDFPWVLLMYDSTYLLHHKEIKNFKRSSYIRNYVKYLDNSVQRN
jgi:oligopeptide transport system substrate-binding protein